MRKRIFVTREKILWPLRRVSHASKCRMLDAGTRSDATQNANAARRSRGDTFSRDGFA